MAQIKETLHRHSVGSNCHMTTTTVSYKRSSFQGSDALLIGRLASRQHPARDERSVTFTTTTFTTTTTPSPLVRLPTSSSPAPRSDCKVNQTTAVKVKKYYEGDLMPAEILRRKWLKEGFPAGSTPKSRKERRLQVHSVHLETLQDYWRYAYWYNLSCSCFVVWLVMLWIMLMSSLAYWFAVRVGLHWYLCFHWLAQSGRRLGVFVWRPYRRCVSWLLRVCGCWLLQVVMCFIL